MRDVSKSAISRIVMVRFAVFVGDGNAAALHDQHTCGSRPFDFVERELLLEELPPAEADQFCIACHRKPFI